MERPTKRMRMSAPESPSCRDLRLNEGERGACLELNDASSDSDVDQENQRTSTTTSSVLRNQTWLYRPTRQVRTARGYGIPASDLAPRAPDTTVTMTEVNVNVQDGSTTVANTVIVQVSDATVLSFASLGVITVSAKSSPSSVVATSLLPGSSLSSTMTVTSSSVSTDSANPIITLSATPSTSFSSDLPNFNGTASSNSTARTVTHFLTSTLRVTFLNGTVFTINDSSSAELSTPVPSTTELSDTSTTLTLPESTSTGPDGVTPAIGYTGPLQSSSSRNSGSTAATTNTDFSTMSSATPTKSSGTGSAPNPGPTTPAVVGGVVGGVAGLALVLLLLLALLRMYRRRLASQGRLPEQIAARNGDRSAPGSAFDNEISQGSSHIPLTAALLSSTKRWRPRSSATTATAATASTFPEPERSFQRIAGRKIAPVLSNNTDQYGGNYGAFERERHLAEIGGTSDLGPEAAEPSIQSHDHDLAESSFYRDSRGFYGGRGDFVPETLTVVPSSITRTADGGARDFAITDSISEVENLTELPPEGYAIMRPGPARIPITKSPSGSSFRLPIQQSPSLDPHAPPTPALPSHLAPPQPHRQHHGVEEDLSDMDESRGSRFMEGV